MPRPKTPATTLEPTTDLEPTPFDGFTNPAGEPQNGHTTPEGIRPSEQCRAPSPLGVGCVFKTEHSGRHSWKPEESSDFGASNEDGKSEQPTLPGTPEPEQTDYTVPTEARFGKAKLMPAPGLKAIGERLIAEDESLEHLLDVEIRYAWRRRGGTSGGTPVYARIKRPSSWEEFLTGGRAVFLVDLSADKIREGKFSDEDIRAALHEQLCRTDVDPDDNDAYRIAGYDFKGNVRTLDLFGNWKPELREMAAHVARLPHDQALDDAAAERDEADEDEE